MFATRRLRMSDLTRAQAPRYNRNKFAPRGEGGNGGIQCPRGFSCFFCRGHLPQTSARSKQYLPVILVRLALFRQNFHERWCRKLLAI